jgi:PAS domain S-box-containing protein
VLQRALEVQAQNAALMAETRGLRDLFMQAPSFMAVLTAPDHTFALVNHALQDLIGHRQVVGRTLAEALPEVAEQGFLALLDQVLASGQPYIGQEDRVELQRTPGGALEERFVDFIFQPVRAATGEILGVFIDGSDVTPRVMGERQRKLLIDELNHRVKNMLAIVQAIARQTLRSTPEPGGFADAFESRRPTTC